jgi:hypothetical protein
LEATHVATLRLAMLNPSSLWQGALFISKPHILGLLFCLTQESDSDIFKVFKLDSEAMMNTYIPPDAPLAGLIIGLVAGLIMVMIALVSSPTF